MAGIYSSINDRDYDLIKKIAWNWYDAATKKGITGLDAPNWNDTTNILLKKICYYTAAYAP